MNKKLIYTAVALILAGWATFLQAQTFTATLTGRNQVPPVLSPASGEITATLTGSTLVVTGSFNNLVAGVDTSIAMGMHVHLGWAGQNGPVIFPLDADLDSVGTSGTLTGTANTFTLDATQLDALNNRRLYVNVHTSEYPAGEIRAQLVPQAADQVFVANMLGSNEEHPVLTASGGALVGEVHGDSLVVSGSFSGLESGFTGSHLHLAIAGASGPVVFALTPTLDGDSLGGFFSPGDNTFTLDSAQAEALKNRRFYGNVHSEENPGGEIRGQLLPNDAIAVFSAPLAGYSEVPVAVTLAHGQFLLEVYDSTACLTGSFHDLGSNYAAAHIHLEYAGRNGPVAVGLTVSGDTAVTTSGEFDAVVNCFPFPDSLQDALFNRATYANVHSENYPGGEIRGQLSPESGAIFNSFMSSAYEVPEVFSGATGDLKAEWSGNKLTVSGSVNSLGATLNLNIAGGAHLHLGLAGQTGGIAFGLTPTLDADSLGAIFEPGANEFTLDSAQIEALRDRRYYSNVHTAAYPSGELRGQLLPQATIYFASPLSGASEVPPVNGTGFGMTVMEINGDQAYLSGSFTGLVSPFNGGAHIHANYAGMAGPVVQPLVVSADSAALSGTLEVDSNEWEVNDSFIQATLARIYYVNIHSDSFPGGEIRGQQMPLATQYFTSTLSGINEVPPNASGGHGDLKYEIRGNTLTVHGSFNDLTSPYAASHIHVAPACENGPVVFALTANVDSAGFSGTYDAEANEFELDSAGIVAISNGNFYANVHSDTLPGGEIRGQVLKETNSFPTDEAFIISPAAGDTTGVGGSSGNTFTVTWNPAFDPDANRLVYILQVSLDSNFTDSLGVLLDSVAMLNVCDSTSFTFVVPNIDSLLDSLGIAVGQNFTFFARVLASDGSLVTPGATTSLTVQRDSVTISQGVDLELDIVANVTQYAQYVDVNYTITITNNGTEEATGVSVAAGLPTGMVHTANFTNKGTYNLFFERWDVGTLAPGESGTLTLVLFPLINDMPITNFVQVLTQDQPDVDSAPGNDVGETPDEDDEAAVTVAGPTLPPFGGVTADLEIFATVDQPTYDIYVDVFYHLTLVNNGPDTAAGVTIRAGLPQGMVHTSNFATHGQYNLFFERWENIVIAPGDTARLDLVLFPLVDNVDLTNFFQVLTSNQGDPDSTPGNGVPPTPQEDDEAVITVTPSFGDPGDPDNKLLFGAPQQSKTAIFPVPASVAVQVQTVSAVEMQGVDLVVVDQTGGVVFTERVSVAKGMNAWKIDVSEFASGMFFVRMPGGETLRFMKL